MFKIIKINQGLNKLGETPTRTRTQSPTITGTRTQTPQPFEWYNGPSYRRLSLFKDGCYLRA